jgi:protein N-terminal methyltransferase
MRRVLTSCRQDEKFQELFERAGLKIVKADLQRGFPAELLPVKMYAARPET